MGKHSHKSADMLDVQQCQLEKEIWPADLAIEALTSQSSTRDLIDIRGLLAVISEIATGSSALCSRAA